MLTNTTTSIPASRISSRIEHSLDSGTTPAIIACIAAQHRDSPQVWHSKAMSSKASRLGRKLGGVSDGKYFSTTKKGECRQAAQWAGL
jgi:hypothetical protein